MQPLELTTKIGQPQITAFRDLDEVVLTTILTGDKRGWETPLLDVACAFGPVLVVEDSCPEETWRIGLNCSLPVSGRRSLQMHE